MNTATAISPLDSRYAHRLTELGRLISDEALARNRLQVEIAWFEALFDHPDIEELPPLSNTSRSFLRDLVEDFDDDSIAQIQSIEARTNHDVKAVEYYLKEQIKDHPPLADYCEFVHFACTSEDINSSAYALMLQSAREHSLEMLQHLQNDLSEKALQWRNIPVLARTHGQPASPTTLGKEMAVFVVRLDEQINALAGVNLRAKLSGATGTYAAHRAAYPDLDWPALSASVLTRLELTPAALTTQIEPHDCIAELLHALIRCNCILLDFSRDIWGYIALGWFSQTIGVDEVGSSTMPHKINPIDFENAEGNIGIANALAQHLATKLPVSRWQRDLSDSTALRNLGVVFGHSLISWDALVRGLKKLSPNQEHLETELDAHWEVLGEAVQTVMRRYGIEEPYEQIKALSRDDKKPMTAEVLHDFIRQLALPQEAIDRLLDMTPADYTGYCAEETKRLLEQIIKR